MKWRNKKCTKICIADGTGMPIRKIYMIITTVAGKRKKKNQRNARTADATERWEKMGIVTSVVGEYTN